MHICSLTNINKNIRVVNTLCRNFSDFLQIPSQRVLPCGERFESGFHEFALVQAAVERARLLDGTHWQAPSPCGRGPPSVSRLRPRAAAIHKYNVAFGRPIYSAMVLTNGHPGFFMRSRKESLRVVSIIFLDMKVPFPPRF